MAKTETPKPAFDFSTLAPEVAELPKQNRDAKPNPFVDYLAESYAEWSEDNSKGGRKVTVPAAHATEVRNLIRRAADGLNIGSRVVLLDSKGATIDQREPAKFPKSGNVTVMYCGRNRKARKSTDAPAAS